MRYMLDTDTCSYLIKGTSPDIDKSVATKRAQSLCISVVTQAELLFGVERLNRPAKLTSLVGRFLQKIPSLAWDDDAARIYAVIRCQLESIGRPIGNLDLLIAAHALAMQCVLVTNNVKHFGAIPTLQMENWHKP